jgi:hypothetical protein
MIFFSKYRYFLYMILDIIFFLEINVRYKVEYLSYNGYNEGILIFFSPFNAKNGNKMKNKTSLVLIFTCRRIKKPVFLFKFVIRNIKNKKMKHP